MTRIDDVEPSFDPVAVACSCCLVVDDALIRDLLDQPATECRCRNPEDDVSSGRELWLFENTALSTPKTRDGEYVMDAAIGEGQIVLERTIDVHIKTLRKKIGDPDLIETVRGVGYRFREASS